MLQDNTKNRGTLFERVCSKDLEITESVKVRLKYLVTERGSIFDEIWFGKTPDLLTATTKEIESFFLKRSRSMKLGLRLDESLPVGS